MFQRRCAAGKKGLAMGADCLPAKSLVAWMCITVHHFADICLVRVQARGGIGFCRQAMLKLYGKLTKADGQGLHHHDWQSSKSCQDLGQVLMLQLEGGIYRIQGVRAALCCW